MDELRQGELDLNTFFDMVATFSGLSNNPADYELFYHTIDGKRVRHDRVHNLYGFEPLARRGRGVLPSLAREAHPALLAQLHESACTA